MNVRCVAVVLEMSAILTEAACRCDIGTDKINFSSNDSKSRRFQSFVSVCKRDLRGEFENRFRDRRNRQSSLFRVGFQRKPPFSSFKQIGVSELRHRPCGLRAC
jgi:hypothetical protein